MKQTERDAIEELAQLLDGALSPDAADAPIRRLAELAATVTENEVVERPTPAERAAVRNQLVADIEAGEVTGIDRVRDAVWDRTARFRNSARVAVASAVASGMLGSAGVAAAAQHALPGDALYGIKRATESVRMSLASGLHEEAQIQLAFAEERLGELRDGADRLSPDETIDTLERMDAASLAASGSLIQSVADGASAEVLTALTAFAERQRAGLVDLYGDLPTAARPFADASLEVLRRIEVEVATTVGPCGVCEQVASGTDVTTVTPGDDITDRGCDCIPTDAPPPPREPGVSVPSSPPTAPAEPSTDGEPREPSSGPRRDAPDVVPSLPGPLDELGDAVDDLVGDIVEGVRTTPTTAPQVVTPLPDPGQAVEDLGGLLGPTQP